MSSWVCIFPAMGHDTSCPGNWKLHYLLSIYSWIYFIFFFPRPNLSLPSTYISNSPPRLVHWREWCSISSPPSLPLTPCLLCAAVNNSAPAVAAFSPLLEDLLWEKPKVGVFEVAGLQGVFPAGLLFSCCCLPGSPVQALGAVLWAEVGPLISKRVQRVTGAAVDDGSLVTVHPAEAKCFRNRGKMVSAASAQILNFAVVLQIPPFLSGVLPASLCTALSHHSTQRRDKDAQQVPRLFLRLHPGHRASAFLSFHSPLSILLLLTLHGLALFLSARTPSLPLSLREQVWRR